MKKLVLLVLILVSLVLISILAPVSTFAQNNVEFYIGNFKNAPEDFQQAMEDLNKGDKFYKSGVGSYGIALENYLKANKFNPDNAELNYRIGKCYLYSTYKAQSIDYFKKASKLNKYIAIDIHFMLACGYHLNYEFDKAIEEYNLHLRTLTEKQKTWWAKIIKKNIIECRVGKKLLQNPVNVLIDNVGEAVNSKSPDYSPLISADESMMIFTSRRESSTGGKKDPNDHQYFEDIYISYEVDGKWQKAVNIGPPLNTQSHDATVGLSPDGQQLFIYNGLVNGGDIFECMLYGDQWSEPQSLPKTINTLSHESAANFSYDGNTIYFVSDRPGGYGDKDIYMSQLDAKGKWGKAINLGNKINTIYDEQSVFMHPDGKTIYFSSKGHYSMGGFDIFQSKKSISGKWSTPKNLGYPINTPDDDVFFVLSASGKHGYYASAKDGGYGDSDIYMITFLSDTVDMDTIRLTILKGAIFDANSSIPIGAKIEIVDNEKNEVISTFTSNTKTGKFLVSLPSGKNYGITVYADDYLFHSENFNIPITAAYHEISKDFDLKKVTVGAKIVLNNIFFDFAKATLRPESYFELNRILKFFTDYPKIKIEISGHTDNKGSLETNIKLSEDRAKAVVDYLIELKVKPDKLEYKGYAYLQPIAPNDTEEGRQLNRRVEFKVISK